MATYLPSQNHPRRIRHAEHCWRRKEKTYYGPLDIDVSLLADQQELIYISADTGCSLEDLQGTMNDRDGWRERESGKSVLAARLDDFDNSQSAKI